MREWQGDATHIHATHIHTPPSVIMSPGSGAVPWYAVKLRICFSGDVDVARQGLPPFPRQRTLVLRNTVNPPTHPHPTTSTQRHDHAHSTPPHPTASQPRPSLSPASAPLLAWLVHPHVVQHGGCLGDAAVDHHVELEDRGRVEPAAGRRHLQRAGAARTPVVRGGVGELVRDVPRREQTRGHVRQRDRHTQLGVVVLRRLQRRWHLVRRDGRRCPVVGHLPRTSPRTSSRASTCPRTCACTSPGTHTRTRARPRRDLEQRIGVAPSGRVPRTARRVGVGAAAGRADPRPGPTTPAGCPPPQSTATHSSNGSRILRIREAQLQPSSSSRNWFPD